VARGGARGRRRLLVGLVGLLALACARSLDPAPPAPPTFRAEVKVVAAAVRDTAKTRSATHLHHYLTLRLIDAEAGLRACVGAERAEVNQRDDELPPGASPFRVGERRALALQCVAGNAPFVRVGGVHDR